MLNPVKLIEGLDRVLDGEAMAEQIEADLMHALACRMLLRGAEIGDLYNLVIAAYHETHEMPAYCVGSA